MAEKRPTLRASLRIAPVEDGLIVFDAGRDEIHHLNALAALIVELCDGKRTTKEIGAALRPIVEERGGIAIKDRMAAEIDAWLDDALDRGIVSFEPPDKNRQRELDAGELQDLASTLRERGETRKAFLCQRRAAELAPDDPDQWYALGELAHIEGDRLTARRAYERYLEFEPGDAEVAHMLVALNDLPPPPRAPDESVIQLFDRFAEFYDENMQDDLAYRAPELLIGAIEENWPRPPSGLDVLDLGCGSGLAGELLRPWARFVEGVDISPAMIERARERGCYDRLSTAELTDWLARADGAFDLVIACDVFVYFGDLSPVVDGAARVLKPGGLFGFTVEETRSGSTLLRDSGRYAHSGEYVEQAARGAGLEKVHLQRAVLRTEFGEPVQGLVVVLGNRET